MPGQPLLNRHQVGGVSRSPDGLFAQQEREPIRGRPTVRGKRTYGGRPGQRVEEQGTWAAQKHSEAGYGRPVDRGVWTAKTVKRPRQQPAHPQYANYWAPLTRKRHILPHPAQPQHTNYWAPRTRKRHQQEHRPQRPTESSHPTQHAKGRAGDRPGPRKGATTRRNVTQGGSGGPPPRYPSLLCPPLNAIHWPQVGSTVGILRMGTETPISDIQSTLVFTTVLQLCTILCENDPCLKQTCIVVDGMDSETWQTDLLLRCGGRRPCHGGCESRGTDGAPCGARFGQLSWNRGTCSFGEPYFGMGGGDRNVLVRVWVLCPFDPLPSSKLEEHECGANYPEADSPLPCGACGAQQALPRPNKERSGWRRSAGLHSIKPTRRWVGSCERRVKGWPCRCRHVTSPHML